MKGKVSGRIKRETAFQKNYTYILNLLAFGFFLFIYFRDQSCVHHAYILCYCAIFIRIFHNTSFRVDNQLWTVVILHPYFTTWKLNVAGECMWKWRPDILAFFTQCFVQIQFTCTYERGLYCMLKKYRYKFWTNNVMKVEVMSS